MPDKSYWAALPAPDFANALAKRIDDFYDYVRWSGRWSIYRRLYDAFHQGWRDLGLIRAGGSQGELALLKTNVIANLATHTVNLICNSKVSFTARAINTDYASLTQTALASSLIDADLMRDKKLGDIARQTVEYATVYGEGWIVKEWDVNGGSVWGMRPGAEGMPPAPIYTGTLNFKAVHGMDMVRDFTNDGAHNWVAHRTWMDRYEALAKWPEAADVIMNARTKAEVMTLHMVLGLFSHSTPWPSSDQIEVFKFFHEKTPALPNGRKSVYIGGSVVDDGDLPYKRLPAFRMMNRYQPNQAFGYSAYFDLLSLQIALNGLYAAAATNNQAFGVQSLLKVRGSTLTARQLAQGLSVIEYDAGQEPKPLNLLNTSPETYNFMDRVEAQMERQSGINAVTRGDPQPSLKSGSALALIQTTSVSFNQNLAQQYNSLLEEVATASIEDYVLFAERPQVALLTGKSNQSYLREFTGADLNKISRVVIEQTNPLANTIAGRAEIANNLVQAGLVKDPKAYIQVLTSGRVEPVTEGVSTEYASIKLENERLSDGKPCQVLITDCHTLHINEHKVLLNSPAARENPLLVQVVTQHIQAHLDELRMADPLLLSVIGEPVPPDNTGAMAPGAPVPGGAKAPGAPPLPLGQGAQAKMPRGPKLPGTGEEVPVNQPPELPPGVAPGV